LMLKNVLKYKILFYCCMLKTVFTKHVNIIILKIYIYYIAINIPNIMFVSLGGRLGH
jgi:hypothetical protein